MDRVREWGRRIWYLLHRRRFEAELQQEMSAHREALGDRRRFGNSLRLREEARDAWGWTWVDDLVRDLRLAGRMLRRSPIFAAISVLVLGLAIGVNLALFQIVDTALIQAPQLKDPATLVRFDRRGPHFTSDRVAYPIARFVEAHSPVLAAVMTRYRTTVAWSDRSEERLTAAFVSSNWFAELGAHAAQGRLFGAADAQPGGMPAIVVSYGFWQRRLGGRPDAVGATLRINDHPAIIVGVAAADFRDVQMDGPPVWMPVSQIASFLPGSRIGSDWTDAEMYARLAPGVSRDAARSSLQTTMHELAQIEPQHVTADEWLEPYLGTGRFTSPRQAQQQWTAILAVTVMTVLVLVIGCLNLSNLALARTLSRVRELTIRVGLGAGRWRIVRHLLAESAVVAALGAVCGLLFEQAAMVLLIRLVPPLGQLDLTPDWRLGLAMFAFTVVAMAAIGLLPAWTIGRSDLARATRDGGERLSQGLQSARLRYLLVAAQVAASCLLLVVTAQLARSLQRVLSPDLGFDYSRVVVVVPSLFSYGLNGAAVQSYWSDVRRAVEARPGTSGTALVSYAPLSGASNSSRYSSTPQLRITVMRVEPSFFSVMRVPILAGRTFERQDDPDGVIIVSRRVALEMFGTTDVIGRRYPKDEPRWSIIGLAGDAHLINLQATDAGEQYLLLRDVASASLLVRAADSPETLLTPLRQATRSADARVVPEIRLMRDDFDRTASNARTTSSVAGAVSFLALVLVCLGLFGVVSHGARARTKEVGIRLALGARSSGIVRMLLRQSMWAIGAGLALGLAGGAILTRLFSGAPFYLEPRDPAAYGAAIAVLATTTAVAAMLPAWRALRANPLRALRQE